MKARLPLRFFVSVVALLLAGCGATEPTPDRVLARNINEFNWWRGQVIRRFAPSDWTDFNEAVKEIRLHAMESVSGQEAIDRAVCAQLHDRRVSEILLLGDQARFERIQARRQIFQTLLDANSLIAAPTAATRTADELSALRAEHTDQLRVLTRELEPARAQWIAHGGTPPAISTAIGAARLPREIARREFERMLQHRREHAERIYGDWPANLSADDEDIPPEIREDFQRRREAAAQNGRVVRAVWLRSRWWLYDEPSRFPQFTDAVLGNLTAPERQQIIADWDNLDAETWARQQASRESPEQVASEIRAQLKSVIKR